jgi:hypothetical protein
MLSDTDVGKRDADVEEGKIGEEDDATADEAAKGSGENLTGVKADLRDLVKARTCFYWTILDDTSKSGCSATRRLLRAWDMSVAWERDHVETQKK